jgi:hypothetical protein
MPPSPAASRRARRLAPATSSGTPLGLPATTCPAPLAPPERTDRAARRVTLHHTASEPLDRSSPRTGFPARTDRRNPCNLSGVARRRATRQGYPCAAPSFADRIAGTKSRPMRTFKKRFGKEGSVMGSPAKNWSKLLTSQSTGKQAVVSR